MIYWLTGQPGAGKTSIATQLKEELIQFGESPDSIVLIDGDDIREKTNNFEYTREGRDKNVKNAQTIASFLSKSGYIVIVSLVSPYREIREEFKKAMGDQIVEWYVYAEEERPRSQYKVPGYQPPLRNYVSVDTTGKTPKESLSILLNSEPKPQYSLFIGRWQPFHDGHQWLIDQRLEKGKNVCIAIRDVQVSNKQPWTAQEVFDRLSDRFRDEVSTGRIKIIILPDIESVNYGRGVGYDVIEHVPPENIKEISATKIREEMRKEGKL